MIGGWRQLEPAWNTTGSKPRTFLLNDDLAGLKKDFQCNFTVVMPLDMFGSKLL